LYNLAKHQLVMQTLTFRVVMGPLLVEAEVQVDVLLLILLQSFNATNSLMKTVWMG